MIISILSLTGMRSLPQRDTTENLMRRDRITKEIDLESSGRDYLRNHQGGKFLENVLERKNANINIDVIYKRKALISESGMNNILGVQDLPFIDYENTVEFHFLLSSLPYNTNSALAKLFSQISGGTELPSFHAGLGVWDTTTDTKMSIQFVPTNFLSCILPKLSNGKLIWDNSGFIVVSDLMSPAKGSTGSSSNWRESRLVSTSSGKKDPQNLCIVLNSSWTFDRIV